MKIRYHINTLLFILIPILLLSSCNALKRGDFMRQVDDTLMFSEIGFHMSDNSELYRNAISEVSGNPSDIYINIPYYEIDNSTPLLPNSMRLYFNVVGKDATVLLDDITEIRSGDIVSFHDGINTPNPRKLTISKSREGSDSPETNEIWVHVTKTITPKLMNPHQPDVPAPLTLEIAFVDERDNKVDMTSGYFDTGQTSWDTSRLDMPTAPGYELVTPGSNVFEVPDVRPYYPGNHDIHIYEGCFYDNNGYYNQNGIMNLFYAPPAIHLSNRTGAPGTGDGSKENPFFLWSEVFAELVSVPGAYTDIFIEATDIPYDTGSGIFINDLTNAPGRYLSIYGGFVPGFETQYDVTDKDRPQSILEASTQPVGGDVNTPGPVLHMSNVNGDYILDNLAIRSSNVDNGTALLLENSSPKISGITLSFKTGVDFSIFDETALTMIGSAVNLSNSVIAGKDGGTGISRGIYLNNSALSLNYDCLILGGNGLDSSTYGIDGNTSNIDIWGGGIWAGYTNPTNNNPMDLEIENIAIKLSDSSLRMESAWVHSADSSGVLTSVSTAIKGDNSSAYITGSTLISGAANSTYGLEFIDPTGNFELYNSVIDVPASSSSVAAGIQLSNTNTTRISGNAIRVGSNLGDTTIGIDLNNCPSVQIHNNLVWTDGFADILGIRTQVASIDNNPVRHNNFWDKNQGIPVSLELIPGVQDTIYEWQLAQPTPQGNVSVPAAIDMIFNYSSEDFDIGRITGNQPDDIVYGGEDIGPIMPPSPPGYDKDGNSRTSEMNIGWSMGPYEYGTNAYLPRDIYVTQDPSLGDDKNPTGSIVHPFQTVLRAISYMAGPGAYGICTIHIAEGIYDASSTGLVFNKDVKLKGGYSPDLMDRDIVGPIYDYPTEITDASSNADQIITLNGVSSETLIEGFTITSTASGADPSRGLYIQGSSPQILENIITSGDSTGESTGIWMLDSPNSVFDGNNISAGSGSPSRGVYIQNSSGVTVTSNRISGGDSTTESYGIFSLSSPDINVTGNSISAGTGNNTYGIFSMDAGYKVFDGNKIFGGIANINSYGVKLIGSNKTRIINNAIHGGGALDIPLGSGMDSRGVEIDGGADEVYLYNNTIFGGRSTINDTAAVRTFNGARPHVINNIIIAGTGAAPNDSIAYQETSAGTPMRFLNNLLLSIIPAGGNPYRDYTTLNYTDVPTMESYLNTNGSTAAGNRISFAEDPSDYFKTFIPGNDDATFQLENWQLSDVGGIENARTGGTNLSGDPFHPFNHDADGNGRTMGWSIGAYEK